MKHILIIMLFIGTINTVSADTTINFSTEKHDYSRWESQMSEIVRVHEFYINEYLGEELECRLVKLRFNNYKSPGVFKKGLYNLTLSGKCNKDFRKLSLDVTYGYSRGEPFIITLRYILDGNFIERSFSIEEYDS